MVGDANDGDDNDDDEKDDDDDDDNDDDDDVDNDAVQWRSSIKLVGDAHVGVYGDCKAL